MSHRILVVEDEPDIAAIVVDYLRHAGYTVEHQAEGRGGGPPRRGAPPAHTRVGKNLPRRVGVYK
ncbi:MAG: DNA-binding response regulator, partial [Acidovorax sp.]|nr:DNA-binding response regulator [Acidovorax sp.]